MKPDKKQMHIYCTDDMRNKLEALASANERSMSSQVQVLINKAYAELMQQSKNNLKG